MTTEKNRREATMSRCASSSRWNENGRSDAERKEKEIILTETSSSTFESCLFFLTVNSAERRTTILVSRWTKINKTNASSTDVFRFFLDVESTCRTFFRADLEIPENVSLFVVETSQSRDDQDRRTKGDSSRWTEQRERRSDPERRFRIVLKEKSDRRIFPSNEICVEPFLLQNRFRDRSSRSFLSLLVRHRLAGHQLQHSPHSGSIFFRRDEQKSPLVLDFLWLHFGFNLSSRYFLSIENRFELNKIETTRRRNFSLFFFSRLL